MAPGSDILEVKDFTVCLDKFQIKWAIRALIFAYAGFVLGKLSITTGAGSTIISKAATAKIALTAAEKTGIELIMTLTSFKYAKEGTTPEDILKAATAYLIC